MMRQRKDWERQITNRILKLSKQGSCQGPWNSSDSVAGKVPELKIILQGPRK